MSKEFCILLLYICCTAVFLLGRSEAETKGTSASVNHDSRGGRNKRPVPSKSLKLGRMKLLDPSIPSSSSIDWYPVPDNQTPPPILPAPTPPFLTPDLPAPPEEPSNTIFVPPIYFAPPPPPVPSLTPPITDETPCHFTPPPIPVSPPSPIPYTPYPLTTPTIPSPPVTNPPPPIPTTPPYIAYPTPPNYTPTIPPPSVTYPTPPNYTPPPSPTPVIVPSPSPPSITYPPPSYIPPYNPPLVITYPPPPIYTTPTAPPPPVAYTPYPPTTPTVPPPPPNIPSTSPVQGLWCVAKPTVPVPVIEQAMDFACGAGADCGPIQPEGSCYMPNTVIAHASYAFNSYWQMTKASGGSCDFGGTAMIITVDPSFQECHFASNT